MKIRNAIGTTVTTLKGDGTIVRHDLLQQTALLRRDEDGAEVLVTLEDLVEARAD